MILINAGRSRRGWSTYANWLFCPQKGAFTASERNDEAPLGTVSLPLQKGSLWHVCLAHHYARIREMKCKGDPDQFYTPRDAVEMVAEKGGCDPELTTNVLNIFSDYVQHFEE